jgi:hypothetical protein
VDPKARVVKVRFRPVCRFDDVKQLRLVEYFNALEEEQLLNRNPDVQKQRRGAELYADLKSGGQVRLAALDQAGLLLQQAMAIAEAMGGVQVVSQRSHLDPTDAQGAR